MTTRNEWRERAYEYARKQPRDDCRCGAWYDGECGCGGYVDYREHMIAYLTEELEKRS